MADLSVFSVSGGGNDAIVTAEIIAAAQAQTVPCGKDSRLALRVANANATVAVVRVAAGDGPRAALGNMDVTVAANTTAYIALFDTARYMQTVELTVGDKVKTVGVVSVALVDSEGTALDGTALGNVSIEAVQL